MLPSVPGDGLNALRRNQKVNSGREKIFSRELANTLRDGDGGMRSMALDGSAIDEY